MTVPTMDTLPRVPDAHGDIVDEKLYSDLYIRTSWVDASVALNQIEKVSKFIIIFQNIKISYSIIFLFFSSLSFLFSTFLTITKERSLIKMSWRNYIVLLLNTNILMITR